MNSCNWQCSSWAAMALGLALCFTVSWIGCSGTPTTEKDRPTEAAADSVELEDSELIPVAHSPIKGAEDAWVTVVVFADFECPFCARLAATLDEVEQTLDDGTMRLVFKHFPLNADGELSPAARGAEAARMQGEFWAMHDALFDEFARLSNDDAESVVLEIAASLELDEEQLRRDMNSDRVRSRIENDRALAGELELQAVPAVFVNGGFIAGAQSAEIYQTAITNIHHILHQSVSRGEMQRAEVYRGSVEPLFAHTRPEEQTREQPPTVVQLPVDGERPETSNLDDGLVQLATFLSFSDEPSLQLQRQLDEMVDEEAVRVTYFHLLHDHDRSTRLAHRAVEGADSPREVASLVQWLSDESNDWQSDVSMLEDYLEREEIVAIADDDFDAIVEADAELAQEYGVFGTPTSFINGIRLVGTPEPGELQSVVEEQLALAERVSELKELSGQALYEEMVAGNRQRKGEHF